MNVLDLGQFCGFIHEPVANHFDLCTFSGTSLLETRIFKLTKPEALAEEFVTSMGTNFSRMHHWTDRLASFPWKPRDRTGSSEIVKKMISQGFQLSSLSLSLSLRTYLGMLSPTSIHPNIVPKISGIFKAEAHQIPPISLKRIYTISGAGCRARSGRACSWVPWL